MDQTKPLDAKSPIEENIGPPPLLTHRFPFPLTQFRLKRSTDNDPMTSTADPFGIMNIFYASYKCLKQTLGNHNTVFANVTL